MDSVNFVEIAQLVSSLAMVVSVIYLARQISEEKIAKKMEFGFNLTDRLYQRYFQSAQNENFTKFLSQNWNEDNFGPIVIPKKGMKVELNRKNISLYKKIISEYEGNKLEINPSQIKVNDIHVERYTFKKDYYWMMGDNRQKSEDSRFWGFVPDDHIVGKPILFGLVLRE